MTDLMINLTSETPKSEIFNSPSVDMSKFPALMSRSDSGNRTRTKSLKKKKG